MHRSVGQAVPRTAWRSRLLPKYQSWPFVMDDIPEGARLAFVASASLSQRGLMLLSGIVWDPVVTLIDSDKAPVTCFFVASRRSEEDRSFGIVKASLRRRHEIAPEAAGFQATLPFSTWNREAVLLQMQ